MAAVSVSSVEEESVLDLPLGELKCVRSNLTDTNRGCVTTSSPTLVQVWNRRPITTKTDRQTEQ